MAAWQYSMHLFPKEYLENKQVWNQSDADDFPGWQGLSISQIATKLTNTFGPMVPDYAGFIFGKEDESCVMVMCDDPINKDNVTEIFIRLDLRSSLKAHVISLFDLGKNLNASLVTEDFKVFPIDDYALFANAIKESQAFTFLKNPIAFLDSLKSSDNEE